MTVFNRKWWSRIGLGLLGTLLAIQLVPYGRDHANPPVTGEPTWDAPETRTLAKQGLAKTLGVALQQEAHERER